MDVGVVSDVHGNRVALEAVLEDMPEVDALVNAGDVVGYNPWPAECVAAMRSRGVSTVMGNHDRAVASGTSFRFNSMAAAGVEYAREELDDDQLAWLEALPDRTTVFDDRIRLVHGHPDDPDHYTYPEEFGPELLADEDVLVLGHTHVQHAASYEEGIVLNPGSVGQPRDGDPDAAYAVLELGEPGAVEDHDVELHRASYDVHRVVRAVEDADLPERIGTRLRSGR